MLPITEDPGGLQGGEQSGWEAGGRCLGWVADGWCGESGEELATGQGPGVLSSVLKGLVTIAAAVGPCQLQERASGKGVEEWRSHRVPAGAPPSCSRQSSPPTEAIGTRALPPAPARLD